MKLDIFCLGILLEQNYSGYEIHRVINTALAHLRQASFGALYPALNRLQAKEFISSEAVSNDLLNNGLGKRIFSITDKGRAHFKVEIKKRMQQEVKQQEDSLTRESIYDLLLEVNKFSAPSSVINEQANLMRKDSLMRMGQQVDEAPEDLFPIDTFLENAEKRVKLDLLFSEFVKFFKSLICF